MFVSLSELSGSEIFCKSEEKGEKGVKVHKKEVHKCVKTAKMRFHIGFYLHFNIDSDIIIVLRQIRRFDMPK